MKIKSVSEGRILFDNRNSITFDHYRDCCECNYADFTQIEPDALNYEFDEELVFENTKYYGFRFGNKNGYMFFIPCYSEQNGYYSSDVDIYYNDELVLQAYGEISEY